MKCVPFFVEHPSRMFYVFDDEDFRFCFSAKSYDKGNGKYSSNKLNVNRYDSLSFQSGQQRKPWRHVEHRMIELSGKALMQMLHFHAQVNGSPIVKIDGFLSAHFEKHRTSSRNSAETYLTEVVPRLIDPTLPLSDATYAASAETEQRPEFWHSMISSNATVEMDERS